MKGKSLIIGSIALSIAALSSCSGPKGWSVSGTVTGAADQKIALQAFNNNNWYTVDSLTVASDGHFLYQAAAPAIFPEVYRLSLDGQTIYFPVDSICKVTVTADASTFGHSYNLDGSQAARRFAEIDSLIATTISLKGEQVAVTDSLLKRQLTNIVLTSGEPIAAYYIINKRIADRPLFDPSSRSDIKVIGAVAQAFDIALPEDPRTASLRNLYLSAKIAAEPERLQSATEIDLPESGLSADIKAYDNRGTSYSLYDVASKGNVVLLSFTNYELENSPAYNVILADLYKQYHDSGLEIFQLAFDSDEAEWKQSAVNLPWITLWNAPEDGSVALISYNVNVLPLTYIIGRDGILHSRVEDPTKLAAEVKKYL